MCRPGRKPLRQLLVRTHAGQRRGNRAAANAGKHASLPGRWGGQRDSLNTALLIAFPLKGEPYHDK
jgi:hypothetical protein